MTNQNSVLSHLLPNTEESEQKYIGYLLQNLYEVYLVPLENYSNFDRKIIVESLLELQEKNLKIDYDSLLLLCKKKKSDFNPDILYKIYNQEKNFENIELFKKEIVEGSLKRKILLQLEELLISTTNKKFFNINDFQNLLGKLLETSYSLGDLNLLDGSNLKNIYKNIQKDRLKEGSPKALGYEVLHRIIKRPGAAGEMTGIIGQKGGGKSALAKNIEQKIVSKGICVISINLEMTLESNMDRFQCMKTGFPLDIILAKDHSPREASQLERALDSWENIKNYLYYTEPTLTLNQLDGLIYKSKQIFNARGVLPFDKYCFVVLDLASMISEISKSKDALQIEEHINTLHTIFRKHGCHGLLLLQANENKLRNGKMFKNPNDLDRYKVGLEDIKNSAAWSERCRVVMTLTRPVQMKKRFFPEQNELWSLEPDIINVNVVKQNDGDEGFCRLIMNHNFRVYPFVEEENQIDNGE